MADANMTTGDPTAPTEAPDAGGNDAAVAFQDYEQTGEVPAHEKITDARADGWSWGDIGSYLGRATATAAGEGYTQDEIDEHLGYDPKGFRSDAMRSATTALAANPKLLSGIESADPALDLTTAPDLRGQYALGLTTGTVKGPDDFASGFAAAALDAAHNVFGLDASHPDMVRNRQAAAQNAADDLAAMLPTNPDLTDAALHLSAGDPGPVSYLKQNLLDHWQETGLHPVDAAIAAENDPDLNAKLTTPPPQPPPLYPADLFGPGRDAIDKFYFVPGEELADEKSVTGALKDLGIDIASTAALGVAGKYVLGPLARLAMDKLGEVPAWLVSKLGAADPVDVLHADGRLLSTPAKDALMPPQLAELREPSAEGGAISVDPDASPAGKVARAFDLEMKGVKPEDFATATDAVETPRAKIERILAMEHRNISDDEIGNGTFFQDLMKKYGDAGVIPLDQGTTELAQGYDAAVGLRGFLHGLMADESGAVAIPRWRTWQQAQQRAEAVTNRDLVRQRIIGMQGQANQDLDHWRGILEKNYPAINKWLPEWERELGRGPAGSPQTTKIGQMLNYIEGRTNGAVLAADHPLRPVADTIRDVEQWADKKLRQQAVDGRVNYDGYIADHIEHQWENPSAARRAFGVGKTGDRGGLLQRKGPPTYLDGISKGLMPKYPNPIEGVINSLHRKITYSHFADMIGDLTDEGHLYWAQHGAAEDVSLNFGFGRKPIVMEATVTDRAAAVQARQARNAAVLSARQQAKTGAITPAQAKAQIDAARTLHNPVIEKGNAKPGMINLYGNPGLVNEVNKWLARGMYANPTSAAIYEKLMYMKNVTTAAKLISPTFHATVEALASFQSAAGMAVENLFRGRVGAAAMNLAKLPFAPIEQSIVGARVRRAYASMDADPVLNYLRDAGLRFLNPRAASMEQLGSAPKLSTVFSQGGGLAHPIDALRHTVRTIGKDVADIAGNPREETGLKRLALVPPRTANFALKEAGRAMNEIAEPFFDKGIGQMKVGVAYQRMQNFMAANPTASTEAMMKYARQVVMDVDNRMGELNFDNVFAPRMVKHIANNVMISSSWTYGTFRGVLQGLGYNLERGFEWNPVATSNLAAGVAAFAFANAVMTKIHTGSWPLNMGTPLHDLLNYRTGGATKWGTPERGMLPTEYKEFFDLTKAAMFGVGSPSTIGQSLTSYAMGKLNPFWQLMMAMTTGQDTIGHRIAQTPGGWPKYLRENFEPIVGEQMAQRRHGTSISPLETLLGWREAPKFSEAPQAYLEGLANVRAKWAKEELRRAQKENADLAAPDPSLGSAGGASGGRGGRSGGGSALWGQGEARGRTRASGGAGEAASPLWGQESAPPRSYSPTGQTRQRYNARGARNPRRY